ncbi:hypothetical protein CP970_40625 [Streptomyces kanamyceticus]|uniref:Transposase DDE domain-containing protein n=1 Tax=Streptomyces kanamyceticus TaxID=1967 RepID=A0A5J6GMW5_STRKN|nr:hypothetical protein CP970_40625 [Streptomyces kanamyceticus]
MRAGAESTVRELTESHGLRRCRYRGQTKVHVQHVLTAIAVNIERLSGCTPPGTQPPRQPRPPSHFTRLFTELAPGNPP